MANFPIQSTTGDPIFRSQQSSINSIRSFSRTAADSSLKLNSQERIVSPGEDALSFSTSRRLRSEIKTLKTVQETAQLNITGLGLAVESLEGIKSQLDKVKKNLVQAQVADSSERDGIQAEIDLALTQIDSTAKNTKLGSRSLLDGNSTIHAYRSIGANGTKRDFSINNGISLTGSSGIQGVRVNKIGVGGPVRTLNDGTTVLSLRVSITSNNKATRATLSIQGTGTAGGFVEFRVTGKLGSTTIRIESSAASLATLAGTANAFNALAEETGVIITSDLGNAVFSTVGFGSDEFIKVETINQAGTTNAVVSSSGGTLQSGSAIGETITAFGSAAKASINGQLVELGGSTGTTARLLTNGYDIEIDFSTVQLTDHIGNTTDRLNVQLNQGVVGLLGSSGDTRDTVQYGYGNFTTENLGRGNGQYTVTLESSAGASSGLSVGAIAGNRTIHQTSVADLGSGGRLSLDTGNLTEALRTIDRATEGVIKEQTRLGTIQGNFIDAVNRAEVNIGNLTSADADIIGVDAATEITNLVQSQLGVSTASSILSQANAIQANVFSLLRG